MESLYKIDLPHRIDPPNYSTLISWWDAWPELRPGHLDFWARGNFTRRLISRNETRKTACIVRVEYIDEMEAVFKRLALLDVEIDFAWCGVTSGPELVIVPQDVDYEDSGGWGYSACAGSKIKDRRGDKEWCPSIAWASLLPDTVTDWLCEQAKSFFKAGKIIVVPVDNIGLRKLPGGESEESLQRVSNSISVMGERAKIKALFNLELPFIEGLSIQDIQKFCEDNRDSLTLYQSALRDLLQHSTYETEDLLVKDLLDKINVGVAELRLSDRTLNARKTLAALGASIGTFLITFGISKLGVSPGPALVGSAGAAIGVIAQISQILESRSQMRRNPFYAIWALQKGKGPQNKFLPKMSFPGCATLPSRKLQKISPFHWLNPPTPGWTIPSAKSRA